MITSALSAFNKIGGGLAETLATRSGSAPAAPGLGAASSFGEALAAAAADTVGTLKDAESMSFQALQGKADTREVVDAVMNAEQSLQAAIAIRDKIVSSYLEISRMQI